MPQNILINLEELSKPINTLINKISNAAGILYEPTRIKRKALAKAEAKKTAVITDIEINDIQKRAMHRFLKEETIKQENIENILEKSFDKIENNATPDNIEDDWITHFFDKSKYISDENMQELWAKVLSGESNAPHSYSKRTIECLSNLDKYDAELFTNFCKFVWNIGDLQPLIFDYNNKIYNDYSINFSTLLHLDEIGLINFNHDSGFSMFFDTDQIVESYFGKELHFKFNTPSNNKLNMGHTTLTKIGKELALVVNASPIDEFYTYVINYYSAQGVTVTTHM